MRPRSPTHPADADQVPSNEKVASGAGTSGKQRGGRRRDSTAVFVLGVLALALNLRPAVTAVPPILSQIGSQLGYSPVAVTLLTTAPVLCFGVFSPLATRMGRRLGDERALGIAIAVVAAGLGGRALFPSGGFFAGTVAAAAGIACMNVLLSSLVKRRMPNHVGALLGGYLALLYIGAIVSSATSVPLYRAGGKDISLAVGVWALPAVAAVVCWLPQLGHRNRGTPSPGTPGSGGWTVPRPGGVRSSPTGPTSPTSPNSLPAVPLARRLLAWQVTGFMGLQSLTYYALVSFLPELFRSRGMSASGAGLVNTVLSVGGLLTALVAPVVVQRFDIARPLLVSSCTLGLLGTVGALVVPLGAALPLMFCLGMSQGVSFALALYFIMARAQTPAVAGALSGMAQGVGYIVASFGPLSMGLLHDATGSWNQPIATLAAATLLTLGFGLLSARHRSIPAAPA